jgi:hypothetical protein
VAIASTGLSTFSFRMRPSINVLFVYFVFG